MVAMALCFVPSHAVRRRRCQSNSARAALPPTVTQSFCRAFKSNLQVVHCVAFTFERCVCAQCRGVPMVPKTIVRGKEKGKKKTQVEENNSILQSKTFAAKCLHAVSLARTKVIQLHCMNNAPRTTIKSYL